MTETETETPDTLGDLLARYVAATEKKDGQREAFDLLYAHLESHGYEPF